MTDLPIGAPGRTLGYIIQDLTPTGSRQYLAKCSRCAWSATFSRTTSEEAQDDLGRHLASCRP